MRFWIAALLAPTLAGCLKTTDQISPDRLPVDRESKPYVVCFISPQDSVLAAKVAMSEPKIVATFEPTLVVKTATVTISNGSRSVRLLYDPVVGYYRARNDGTFPVRAGQTYQLTVLMDENRRVTAQTTVPPLIPIERVRLDSVVTTATPTSRSVLYTATIFWNSPGGVNYYRGWGEITQVLTDQNGRLLETRVNQPSFTVERENSDSPGGRSVLGTYTLNTSVAANVSTKEARIGLFNTDVSYYRYHASLQEQLNRPTTYFSQAPVLFSNVEGGYGVFASYNASFIDITK